MIQDTVDSIKLSDDIHEGSYGYWTDISGLSLADDSEGSWVHALPVGNYDHPIKGKLSFTLERISRFAENINNRIRGIDPDIDYDHKLDPSKGNSAAGWVKKAEARHNGLWLFVEWTSKAKQAVRDREYRYFSSEFVPSWKDEKTGKEYQDVLLGGGLTNRPFVKDLVPINLSEMVGPNEQQEETMDPKLLAQLLGLSEDATEDQIKQKITQLNESGNPSDTKLDLSKLTVEVKDNKLVVGHPDGEGEFEYELEKKEEKKEEKELAKLAEDNPALATLLSEHDQMKEAMQTMQAATRLSEVTTQLEDIKHEDKVLPPVAVRKLRDVMVRLPVALSDEVAEAIKEAVKVGLVTLGEKSGKGRDGSPPEGADDKDAVIRFTDKVDEVLKDEFEGKPENYRQAVQRVQESEPTLFAEYRWAVAEGATLTE